MKAIRNSQAFTLIEVVIVLAIASLIILIVLLAISGAQRTRRDTTRKSQAGQLAAALDSYAANNDGNYGPLPASYTTNITDPSDGQSPQYFTGAFSTAANPHLVYHEGAVCSGNTFTNMTGPGSFAGPRQWAMVYWSEGANTTVCIDNK